MNILHFSTYDQSWGAAKATYRLHSAFRGAGQLSRMIVRFKQSDDDDVKRVNSIGSWRLWQRRLERKIEMLRENRPSPTYTYNLDLEPNIETQTLFDNYYGAAEVICLHWVADFLTVQTIRRIYERRRRPLVWIMMDQEPITGGCHYSFDCSGFTKRCGNCPQLNSDRLSDRSRTIWTRKYNYLRDIPITFVAATSWVARRIRESSLFSAHRIENIPLAIDTTIFRPFDTYGARDLLHLPKAKKIILCGASLLEDPRKGMTYLIDALQTLASMLIGSGEVSREDILVLIVGQKNSKLVDALPFTSKYLGYIQDDLVLALAYQAADIFVCPSVEDAGPMMIPESMLCGTPVVAFNTGGAPDLVDTMRTGYLASYKDSTDLAKGIHTLITAKSLVSMRTTAHEVALSQHSPSLVIARHLELYDSLLKESQISEVGVEE
jgi:glycosyltransferase involved in cell wall biosynthesis